MPNWVRSGLGVVSGKIASVSTQLGNRRHSDRGTPFPTSLASIFSEIVETRSKADMDFFSIHWTVGLSTTDFNSPSSKTASASKSWTCNHVLALQNRPVINAPGQQ